MLIDAWAPHVPPQLRGKYGLDGSTVKDVLIACCCVPCATQQHATQLDAKGCEGPPKQEMKDAYPERSNEGSKEEAKE